MRVDMRPQRLLMFALVSLAAVALLAAWLVEKRGVAEKADEAVLLKEGVVVTASVIEVTNYGQYGVPLEVEVRLPDGRTAEVDVSESDRAVRPGSQLEILVQPSHISNNRPTDVTPSQLERRISVALLRGLALACLVICVLVYRRSRTRDQP